MSEEVEYLIESKQSVDPGNMGPLFEWLPHAIWPSIKALEGLKKFAGDEAAYCIELHCIALHYIMIDMHCQYSHAVKVHVDAEKY